MTIALTVICAAACVGFIFAEHAQSHLARVVTKVIASTSFVLIGLGADISSPFARWILAGLILGAVGDIALLGYSTKAFMAGLVAFLGGHVAYIVAAAQLAAPSTWPALGGPLIAAPCIAGVVALMWLWRHLGALRYPVVAYVIAIVAMVVAATAVAHGGLLPAPQRTLFVVGAVLFFISDLSVARNRFIEKTVRNLVWGLPAYFAAQLLIAWTLVGLTDR